MRSSRLLLVWSVAAVLLSAGCENRTYREYYNNEGVNVPTESCWDYLSSRSDLSVFCNMLKQTGYDKVLTQNTSFTVWAPANSALSDIDTTDLQEVTELVLTHISRFAYTTSTQRDEKEKITLLSGKVISFVGMDFGGVSLKEANINVKNGLIHTLNGHAVYKPNLWEMTMRLDGLDSIGSYLSSLSKEEFSQLLSTEIGTNVNGQPIYDSVFVSANYFLDEVADIDYEDTVFTVLFPDNQVWNDYCSMVENYYVTSKEDGGAVAQRDNSRKAIINDLVFVGSVDADNLPDSLVTTSGLILYNADSLFRNVERYECSNGYMYVNHTLSYKPQDTWLKPIKIEAESVKWGRMSELVNIYARSSVGKRFEASNNSYIEVETASGASSTDKAYVEYCIPNILSTQYNIYCVFIPEGITESTDRPGKVAFELSDSKGKKYKTIHSAMQTDPLKIDTVLVGQYTFANCDIFDDESSRTSDISTRLRVINKQNRSRTNLTNILRPDVIIFEPVHEQ